MPCAVSPVDPTIARLGWGYGYFIRPRGREGGPPVRHVGLDFMADAGSPVVAAYDGIVAHVASQPYGSPGTRPGLDALGHYVVVSHGAIDPRYGNVATRYAHLRAASSLRVGQRIAAGDLVGYVGTSGRAPANRSRAVLFFQALHDDGVHYDAMATPLHPLERFFGLLNVSQHETQDPGPPITPYEQVPPWGGRLEQSAACATGMGTAAPGRGSGIQYSRFGQTRLSSTELYSPAVYDETAPDRDLVTTFGFWGGISLFTAAALYGLHRFAFKPRGLGALCACPCDVNPYGRACVELSERALRKQRR